MASTEVMRMLTEKLLQLAEEVDKNPHATTEERQAVFDHLFPNPSELNLPLYIEAYKDLGAIISNMILWLSLLETLKQLDHNVPLSKMRLPYVDPDSWN